MTVGVATPNWPAVRERYEDWRVPAVSLDMTGPGSSQSARI